MTRVPVSRQVAQTECGLCAVRSLLAFHGQDLSIAELRNVVEPGRDGLSLRQMAELLRRQGVKTSIYKVRAAAGLELLDGPFIAHWKGYHFVVVEKLTPTHAVIMDPMVGRTKVSRASVEEDFSGQVLVAVPGPDFTTARRPVLSAWRGKPIWPRSSRGTYAALVAVSLLVFGFTLSIPLLTQTLVDATAAPDFSLARALGTVLAVAVGYVAILILRTYVTTRLVRAVSWQLLSSAFEHLIRLPLRFFMARPPGELMYRLNSLNQVRDIIASKLIQGVLDTLSALVLLGYVFWVAVPLGLVVTALALLLIAVLALSNSLLKDATDSEVHHNSRTQSIQLDAVVSITNLRIGGYAGTYLDDWRASYRDALTAMVRRMRIQQGWTGAVVLGVQAFAPLSIMIVSLAWARSGTVSLGQAIAVQGVSALLFGLSSSVFGSWIESTVASRYLERADDIYAYPPESSGGDRTDLPHNGITLRGVGFRYTDHSPEVLRDIDVDIEPGSVVALVGESGSGKTTLGKILCSLYAPTAGTISYGGRDAREFDLDGLRGHIGYIPQDGFLHNRTLAANLTLGTPADDETAIAFCRELPFMDFVDELPMGYHTVVSEMGSNFSGGQRQRIAIAKALLRRPRILVLDEATSALDNWNQRLVHESVARLACTQVIIAHRLSTVVHADRILVMADGRIQDAGTHDELAGRDGLYARMFGSDREAIVHG